MKKISNNQEKCKWIEDRLKKLDIDILERIDAICDDKIDKSYQLLIEKPNITKEEFLRTMRISERGENRVPFWYRNLGNGNFDREKIFNDIKEYVEKGNDINSFFKGESVLYIFLYHYYHNVVYNPIIEDEDDDGYDDGSDYSDELLLPLEKRSYDILSKIQYLIDNGVHINKGNKWLPLMCPFEFGDYEMAKFLIKNGADIHLNGKDCGELNQSENYYIDTLDETIYYYSFEKNAKNSIFEQVEKLVNLIAENGVKYVHTRCIEIDSKNNMAIIKKAHK